MEKDLTSKHVISRRFTRGQERQQVIIRTICEKTKDECPGFKSFIQAKLKQPGQLMFLGFPRSVPIHELSEAKRMEVLLKAKLVFNHGARIIFDLLTDLSGGRFEYAAGSAASPSRDDLAEVCFEHPETEKIENRVVQVCFVPRHQYSLRLGLAFRREPAADPQK